MCRLAPDAPVPEWATLASIFSVMRTRDELSIVVPQEDVPKSVVCQRDFRALQVVGPLEFDQVGVLASLATPLADAGISIFAISTYDTDYILVRQADLSRAIEALRAAGHTVGEER